MTLELAALVWREKRARNFKYVYIHSVSELIGSLETDFSIKTKKPKQKKACVFLVKKFLSLAFFNSFRWFLTKSLQRQQSKLCGVTRLALIFRVNFYTLDFICCSCETSKNIKFRIKILILSLKNTSELHRFTISVWK